MTKVNRPGVEDTSARDPYVHLLGAMSDGSSKYITDMEAAGQRQLVQSQDLPTRMGAQAEYEALGFTFGDPHPSDPMFRPATLPAGWKREGSDHAMWSYIVDELGRRRVAIFYKAAFYDRDAFMSLNTVFGYVSEVGYTFGTPILDDVWCTPAAVVEAANGTIKRANETLDLYGGKPDSYPRERCAEARKTIEWATALIARVTK